MDRRISYSRALEEQLRAQLGHLQACAGKAVAAGDPRVKSAWIDAVAQLGKAMAATGSVIAELKWVPRGSSLSALGLRLPQLPGLPEIEEGTPPSAKIRKTTPDRISSPINSLTGHRSKGSQVKSKGGAPRGNRNAQKSGCHTAAFRELHRELALYVRTLRRALAPVRAALPKQPKRVVYLITRPERCYVRTRRGTRQHETLNRIHPPLEGGSKNLERSEGFFGEGLSQSIEASPSPNFAPLRCANFDPPSRGG